MSLAALQTARVTQRLMERWELQHRAFAVEQFFISQSVIQTQRNFRRHFHTSSAPSRKSILRFVQAFRERGSVADKPRIEFPKCVRTPTNIQLVHEAIDMNPTQSLRRLSHQLNISYGSTQRIVRRDLKLYPYRIQLVQSLSPADIAQRLAFATWFQQKVDNDASFTEHLFMSDEAHFHLSGHVNKQNCRFWSTENPRLLHEIPLHSQKVTVWCAVSMHHIVGPYFFEDDDGECTTVNGDRYRTMLSSFFIPELHRLCVRVRRTWFQQDGATCHTANETMAMLRQHFQDRLISKKGFINWPPRSPDLTAPDFFLWGYLKSQVYRNNPTTLEQLRNNIRKEIMAIDQNTLRTVMHNAVARAHECVICKGHHLQDILFH